MAASAVLHCMMYPAEVAPPRRRWLHHTILEESGPGMLPAPLACFEIRSMDADLFVRAVRQREDPKY